MIHCVIAVNFRLIFEMPSRARRVPPDPVKPLSIAITKRFPPELHDVIIDFLGFDKRALSACALVRKTWLPRSRLHLFHDVRFHQRNFNRFFDLLGFRSFSKHAHSLIHTVKMEEQSGNHRRWMKHCLPLMKGFSVKNLTLKGLGFTDGMFHEYNTP